MNYKTKLLIASCLPVIVLTALSLTLGLVQFRRSLYTEKLGNLCSTAFAAESLYLSHGYGNYGLKADGNVWRGMNFNVSEETWVVDELREKTGVNITFFFGSTAVMTSIKDANGKRLIGVQADSDIQEHTLKDGSQIWYTLTHFGNLAGLAYVIPIRQESGEIAGALMASQSADGFNATIRNYVLSSVAVTLAVLLLVIGFIYFVMGRFSQEFHDVQSKSQRDLLTSLYNKISFEDAVRKAIARRGSKEMSVLFILDFDNFKHVNDGYGHKAGDDALKGFGEILMRAFRTNDIIGRVGGDEFMVFMTKMSEHETPRVEEIADEIQRELNALDMGVTKGFSCSIGIATDTSGYDFAALYKLADGALYEAKERGKACFVRHDSATHPQT